jgi:hypothetical protein
MKINTKNTLLLFNGLILIIRRELEWKEDN